MYCLAFSSFVSELTSFRCLAKLMPLRSNRLPLDYHLSICFPSCHGSAIVSRRRLPSHCSLLHSRTSFWFASSFPSMSVLWQRFFILPSPQCDMLQVFVATLRCVLHTPRCASQCGNPGLRSGPVGKLENSPENYLLQRYPTCVLSVPRPAPAIKVESNMLTFHAAGMEERISGIQHLYLQCFNQRPRPGWKPIFCFQCCDQGL